MKCLIDSDTFTGADYENLMDFFKVKIGTGGKSACINRLILNFSLYDKVNICSKAYMAKLDRFMRKNFSDYHHVKGSGWLEQSTYFIQYCVDNLKGADRSEFPVFGWCILEDQKLVRDVA